MATLTRDARGFVDGVIRYMRSENRGVTSALPKVQSLLNKMSARDRKEKSAAVISAVEIAAGEKLIIQKNLEKLVDHPLEIEYSVKPELIAGLRAQIGDFVIDTSLANQLDRIAASISS